MKLNDIKIRIGPLRIRIGAQRIREIIIAVITQIMPWDKLVRILEKSGVETIIAEAIVEEARVWLLQELDEIVAEEK